MIVVDANIIAYLVMEGPWTGLAREVRNHDPHWVVPGMCAFEFQNVLAMILRKGDWELSRARQVWETAKSLMGTPKEPLTVKVFSLVIEHKITAYDAQYVALAMELGVPLVTEDKELLRKFPGKTVSMEGFLKNSGRPGLQEPARKYRVARKTRRSR